MADEQEDVLTLDVAAAAAAEGEYGFVLALEGVEGPLHMLPHHTRSKKLDVTKVPIGDIADQYLAFISEARAANIEIAGDYLVIAAWLALLKSRLLIPKPQLPEDEPDPEA